MTEQTQKQINRAEDAQGQVTGGKWMGRVIHAAQQLAYGLGYGAGTAAAGGRAAIEGLMDAMDKLAQGEVSLAQRIGAAISKGAGATVQKLQGLDQKPYADREAPSLTGMLANAFKAGAHDGEKKMRALKRTKGKARGTFSRA